MEEGAMPTAVLEACERGQAPGDGWVVGDSRGNERLGLARCDPSWDLDDAAVWAEELDGDGDGRRWLRRLRRGLAGFGFGVIEVVRFVGNWNVD
ncbi:hypothetical protein M0R45_002220 [Rubus argutus]|uniref:Uncharacterized protein n=1 Tax=Rubus argutus TaxID=59490 RepID=A0AAW1VJ97_RUBAR